MRRWVAIVAWQLGAVACLACSERPPQRPPAAPPAAMTPADSVGSSIDTSSSPLDTAVGRCGVAFQMPTDQQKEVIDALRAAYGLEAVLMNRSTFDTISREEVYAHYRKGFGEQLATQLTDYSWHPQTHNIRATDPALTVPDTVGVLELSQDRASVAWIPSTDFRRQWNAPRCFVDRLERENGQWIVQAREP